MQGWYQERGPDCRTHVMLPEKGWHLTLDVILNNNNCLYMEHTSCQPL